MCGIAGKLWFDTSRPADRDTVEAMTRALVHRGPDGHGLVADGSIALGHRRLAIVDLSERGAQPMVGAGGCLLVANGEIYNHAELRADLGLRGHRFASDCDVEAILPLYEEWYPKEGARFVRRLDGMFAFALWDPRARRLILARDRAGQKPLVYAADGERIAFASELAALRAEPSLDRSPDWDALSDYLSFRVVPHPRSAWRGARKLEPGHVLTVEDGELRDERYWCLAAGADEGAPSPEEAAEEVARLLEDAVRRRLMSDVPVGALLSGGVDSAAVVAFMARHTAGRVRTFTMGFEDAAYDESQDALRTARLFDTEHHHEVVRPDALALIDDVVRRYGEPFADASALPTLMVSRMAGAQLKVVLTGDGGDESFAGYDRHRALLLAQKLDSRWAGPLRAALAVATPSLGLFAEGGQRSLGNRLRRFHDALSLSPRGRNHLWRLGMKDAVRAELLTPEATERLGHPSFYGADSELPLRLNEALVLDVDRYLPDDILVKVDIASMAHSLEARAPFLDRRLMEFTASLPGHYKANWRSGKRLLRAALADVLPADVISGPKRGFGVPLDAWFAGPLADHARDVLLSTRARQRGLFRADRVAALIDAHVQRKVAAHETLFTLLVLERWFLQEESA